MAATNIRLLNYTIVEPQQSSPVYVLNVGFNGTPPDFNNELSQGLNVYQKTVNEYNKVATKPPYTWGYVSEMLDWLVANGWEPIQ